MPIRQLPEGKSNQAVVERFLAAKHRYMMVIHEARFKPHNVYHCMREACKCVNRDMGREVVKAYLRQERVFLENLDMRGDAK